MQKLPYAVLIVLALLIASASASARQAMPAPDVGVDDAAVVCGLMTLPPTGPLPPVPPLPEPAGEAVRLLLQVVQPVQETVVFSIAPLVPLLREVCFQSVAVTDALVEALVDVVWAFYMAACEVLVPSPCNPYLPPWVSDLVAVVEEFAAEAQQAVEALVQVIMDLIIPVCGALLCGPLIWEIVEAFRAAAYEACSVLFGPALCEPLS